MSLRSRSPGTRGPQLLETLEPEHEQRAHLVSALAGLACFFSPSEIACRLFPVSHSPSFVMHPIAPAALR
jgi:hypothetical protein